jgi:hypothetical protein
LLAVGVTLVVLDTGDMEKGGLVVGVFWEVAEELAGTEAPVRDAVPVMEVVDEVAEPVIAAVLDGTREGFAVPVSSTLDLHASARTAPTSISVQL